MARCGAERERGQREGEDWVRAPSPSADPPRRRGAKGRMEEEGGVSLRRGRSARSQDRRGARRSMWCVERLLRARPRPAAPSAFAPCSLANVLTPDSIPEFCIPPRILPSTAPAPGPARRRGEELRPGPAGAGGAPDPTDWDPRSQAALSLPHLPRGPTSYGFCALRESPNTRRKESLFLGGAGALLLQYQARPLRRPRAHTYCGTSASRRGAPDGPVPAGSFSSSSAGSSPCASPRPRDAPAPRSRSRSRYRRLLRAPDALLGRALRAGGSRLPPRARSVSSADEEDEDADPVAAPRPAGPARPRAPSPPPFPAPPGPPQVTGHRVTLGRDGAVLHLATEYCPASRRLRIRLLRAEGLYGGAAEPGAIGCRVSFALEPPGKTRKQRSAVVRRSPEPVFNQDFFFDGLSEDDLRRTAVRLKAENKGRGLERGRLLGRGELELRAALL